MYQISIVIVMVGIYIKVLTMSTIIPRRIVTMVLVLHFIRRPLDIGGADPSKPQYRQVVGSILRLKMTPWVTI